jgi:hypothetical protein
MAAPIDALFRRSKAALDAYDRNPFAGGAPNADYAEAVLGVGDNAGGSTNPGDYDDNGARRRPSGGAHAALMRRLKGK